MRFKRVAHLVANRQIDTSRALPIAQFASSLLRIATTTILLAIHVTSLLLTAGSSK